MNNLNKLIEELHKEAELFKEEADGITQIIKTTENVLNAIDIGFSFEIQIDAQDGVGSRATLRVERTDNKTLRIKLSDPHYDKTTNLIETSLETRIYYSKFMPDLIKKAIETLKIMRQQ